MAPGAHFLVAWLGASCCLKRVRERHIVTLSGVVLILSLSPVDPTLVGQV